MNQAQIKRLKALLIDYRGLIDAEEQAGLADMQALDSIDDVLEHIETDLKENQP